MSTLTGKKPCPTSFYGQQRRHEEPKKRAKVRKKNKRVNKTIDYAIKDDGVQRLYLTLTGEFDTIQQIEMPNAPVIVTEHRFPLYESPTSGLYYPYVPEVHSQSPLIRNRAAPVCWPRRVKISFCRENKD